MSSVKRIYLAVAGGLVATGLVLAAIGFVASGFNLAVLNTQIDLRDDTIILGGVEIDDPTGLPLSRAACRGRRDPYWICNDWFVFSSQMIELVAAVPPFGRTTTGMSTPRSEPFLRDLPSRSSCVVNRSSTDERLMGISRLRANPAHRSGLPS